MVSFFFLINQGALFQSPHIDENDVQTISHKCEVLSYTEYGKTQRPDSHVTKETDVYYLAGTYEPTIGLLKFEKDVMWCNLYNVLVYYMIQRNWRQCKKKLLTYTCICSCFFNCDIKKIMFVHEHKYSSIELKVAEILLKRTRSSKD